MKLKHFFLCGATLFASAFLFSCQQENEPKQSGGMSLEEQLKEWSINVNLPDNFRTRAGAAGTVGADGLYTFSRSIDKLWYAVYYDGKLFYDSSSDNSPVPQKNGDGQFSVLFKFNNNIDPSKVYLFF